MFHKSFSSCFIRNSWESRSYLFVVEFCISCCDHRKWHKFHWCPRAFGYDDNEAILNLPNHIFNMKISSTLSSMVVWEQQNVSTWMDQIFCRIMNLMSASLGKILIPQCFPIFLICRVRVKLWINFIFVFQLFSTSTNIIVIPAHFSRFCATEKLFIRLRNSKEHDTKLDWDSWIFYVQWFE